jgi:hypothetical protein
MVICEQDSYATTQVNGHTFNTFKKGKKVTLEGGKSLRISIFIGSNFYFCPLVQYLTFTCHGHWAMLWIRIRKRFDIFYL